MLIESFLKYLRYELNLSTYTVLSYKNDLRQFTDFIAGGEEKFEPKGVTQNDVRAWMVQLANSGDVARTVRRKVQAVRALYKYLMKHGEVDADPAADIELAKIPKKLPSYIRQSSMDTLLAEPIDENDFIAVRDRLIVLTLYSTGIRRAELIGLLDSNVDTDSCEMKVHGKRDKDRIVPFGDELRDAIEHYRKLRDKEVGKACTTLFVRPNGEPLYPSLVYNTVHNALLTVGGGQKLSPHVLRHTFASAMLNGGAGIDSVKELLGHESLAATQVYTHITFSELKNNYKLAHPRAQKKEDYYGS
ncbi:MAG: tyrosine-type recombinase/integrase [Muribaculaceae bacterium]|jgi:integrase/recombinase XerC|nr:tyrosine-type recombinase/integrase [Muribaculaceae bacterium]